MPRKPAVPSGDPLYSPTGEVLRPLRRDDMSRSDQRETDRQRQEHSRNAPASAEHQAGMLRARADKRESSSAEAAMSSTGEAKPKKDLAAVGLRGKAARLDRVADDLRARRPSDVNMSINAMAQRRAGNTVQGALNPLPGYADKDSGPRGVPAEAAAGAEFFPRHVENIKRSLSEHGMSPSSMGVEEIVGVVEAGSTMSAGTNPSVEARAAGALAGAHKHGTVGGIPFRDLTEKEVVRTIKEGKDHPGVNITALRGPQAPTVGKAHLHLRGDTTQGGANNPKTFSYTGTTEATVRALHDDDARDGGLVGPTKYEGVAGEYNLRMSDFGAKVRYDEAQESGASLSENDRSAGHPGQGMLDLYGRRKQSFRRGSGQGGVPDQMNLLERTDTPEDTWKNSENFVVTDPKAKKGTADIPPPRKGKTNIPSDFDASAVHHANNNAATIEASRILSDRYTNNPSTSNPEASYDIPVAGVHEVGWEQVRRVSETARGRSQSPPLQRYERSVREETTKEVLPSGEVASAKRRPSRKVSEPSMLTSSGGLAKGARNAAPGLLPSFSDRRNRR